MIKNFKLKIKNSAIGFTLIEMVVMLGILVVLMTTVGGIMTSSFRVKNNTQAIETASNEANIVMAKLKNNVFDADGDSFVCPVGVGTSISFGTKSGGATTLWCDDITAKIASNSALSGSYQLTNSGVTVRNCANFVSCVTNDSQGVIGVNFNLDIGLTGGSMGNQFWTFVSKVVVR